MRGHAIDAEPLTASAASDLQAHFGVIPGLVWAFRIHDDGSAENLPVDRPVGSRHEGWLWLHLNLANVSAGQWVTSAGLPAQAVATLMSRDRHQQLHATNSLVYGSIADFIRRFGVFRL